MAKPVEITTLKEVLKALKDGNRPYMPGGYNTKEELRRIREDWSKKAGFPLRFFYSGENTHRYYIEKANSGVDLDRNKRINHYAKTIETAIDKLSNTPYVKSYIKLKAALEAANVSFETKRVLRQIQETYPKAKLGNHDQHRAEFIVFENSKGDQIQITKTGKSGSYTTYLHQKDVKWTPWDSKLLVQAIALVDKALAVAAKKNINFD